MLSGMVRADENGRATELLDASPAAAISLFTHWPAWLDLDQSHIASFIFFASIALGPRNRVPSRRARSLNYRRIFEREYAARRRKNVREDGGTSDGA
jgi:hypothetical protein